MLWISLIQSYHKSLAGETGFIRMTSGAMKKDVFNNCFMRVVDKFDKQNTLSWVVQKIVQQLAHAFHYIVSRLMRSKSIVPWLSS